MKISIIKGDITSLKIDAIVNAANHTLLGGGGVDGMIHYHAGPELLEECKTLNGCEKGEAKITKGYNLSVKHVIHTVGPVYGQEDGRESEVLFSCYNESLKLAKKHRLKSIAFPAISTGCYKFPKNEAAKIAFKAVNEFSENNPEVFDEIVFVLFDQINYAVYKAIEEKGEEASLEYIDRIIMESD